MNGEGWRHGNLLSDVGKRALRKALCLYAQHLPNHWKKEGLIIRLSRILGLDSNGFIKGRLWFGSRMFFRLSDYFQKRAYYFGSHEEKTEKYISGLIRSNTIFLDIGANIGIYTLLAARKTAGNGKVVSVEPVPEIFEQLSKNINANCCENVFLSNVAAWDKNTEVELKCGELDNLGSYGISLGKGNESVVTVRAVRLDDLIKELQLPRVDLIKMDIEGAELPALRGAYKIISRDRPILILEIDPLLTCKFGYGPEDILDFLGSFNYECYAIGEGGHFYSKSGFNPSVQLKNLSIRDNYAFYPAIDGISHHQ